MTTYLYDMNQEALLKLARLLELQGPEPTTEEVRAVMDAMRPLERGQFYHRALEQGYFTSLRKMSEELGEDVKHVSRFLRLARFPSQVLAAFSDPKAIQASWGIKLEKALLRDPDLFLARAKEIQSRRAAGEKLPAAAVYKELTA